MALVHVVESGFVAPSESMPVKDLWLSPLDVPMSSRGHTPTVYFYSSGDAGSDDFFDVDRLKKSLAKALVAFYPLAGRLDTDDTGRTQIKCSNEGALFVVARVDLKVDDFNHFKPSPKLKRLFIPPIERTTSILLAVQVTFFKLGGVALGIALHHSAVDAMSAVHFKQTWSSLCKDTAAAVELPCHDRSLLRARSPPVRMRPDLLSMFCPRLMFSTTASMPRTVTETFPVSHTQLASLKRRCGGAMSTFCAVSALVWQCTCVARRLPPDVEVRLCFPANIRRRMSPPLPDRYFGNAVVSLLTMAETRGIASATLGSVARRISGTIRQMDDDLGRSVLDYLELNNKNMGDNGHSLLKEGSMPETDLRINSWLGMPFYDVDFGWGKPRVMSRAENIRSGFVYLMDAGPEAKDSAVHVMVCMEASNMREFERLLYAQL